MTHCYIDHVVCEIEILISLSNIGYIIFHCLLASSTYIERFYVEMFVI
jgi:hypothetical protein